jgi:hypothetical protein
MNMCLTIDGEEQGRCGVSVIHGGIPHDGACPLGGGAHGDGNYPLPEGGGGVLELWPRCLVGGSCSQYLGRGGGGKYPAGGGDGHIEVCLVVGDPPHSITDVGPV